MQDLLGWQQLRWGMTTAEVINMLDPEKLQRMERAQYRGMYADLIIPNVQVGRFSFDVIFQMHELTGGLGQI